MNTQHLYHLRPLLLLICLLQAALFMPSTAASLSDISFEINSDHVVITDCDLQASGRLDIPSRIQGLPVTIIAADAFRNCQNLTSIRLPQGLLSIGREAFWGTTITSLSIPSSVNELAPSALVGTRNISEHRVSGSNRTFTTLDGTIYSRDLATLVAYPVANNEPDFTIPDEVTNIAGGAFEGNLGLLRLTLNDQLTRIGERAFAFTRFSQVTHPPSLTSIGDEAYFSCNNLVEVDLSPNLESIGSATFQNCPRLISITLPDSLSSIGASAFESCIRLNSIDLGDGIREIPPRLCYQCVQLRDITLNPQLTEIGDAAFDTCIALGSITLNDNITRIGSAAFADCSSLSQITLPAMIDSVERLTFAGCRALQSVTFPLGLKTIDESAFQNCVLLQNFTLPPELESIGETAFFNCTRLNNLSFPISLTNIEQRAFSNSGVRTLLFQDSPTLLSPFAFSNCSNLISVLLGNQLSAIPEGTFQNCRNLRSISLPDQITQLGPLAFQNCSNLGRVDLPADLTELSPSAFQNCSSLDTLTITPDNPTFSTLDNALYNKDLSTLLMVPAGTAGPNFQVPDSVIELGEAAFAFCQNLTGITLSPNLEIIGDRAFDTCQNLRTLTLPPFVRSIGQGAFHRCQSLTRINIPADITHLPTLAFSQLLSLNEIFFHGNIPTLGDDVFLDTPSDFQVVVHPISQGFQDQFAGRTVNIANLPRFPTPIITGSQLSATGLEIQLAATAAPLLLFTSTDLQTWSRVRNVSLQQGSFSIPQSHPSLSEEKNFFQVRISSD